MGKSREKKGRIKTRELTKNEKVLLSLLCIIILSWIVYRFIITPQIEKLKDLSTQKIEYQTKIDEMNDVLRGESRINKEWDSLHKEKEEIVSRYFPRMDQPQIIYLLNRLIESENLSVIDLNFNRPGYEDIGGFQVKSMDISIPYKGSYAGVIDIINSLRYSPRKILVDSLSMDRDNLEDLNGNMSLRVYSLDGIADTDKDVVYIDTAISEPKQTPFLPYTEFAEDQLDNSISVEENTPIEDDFIRRQVLHDFEYMNYNLIPSSTMVKGKVLPSTVAKSNKYSLRFEYNILALEKENRAYVDISKSNITLKYPPNSIGMWVYAYGYSPGTIGLSLKGQAGEEIDVKATEGVNWMGWQYIEASVPMDIKLYPLNIDKLYYELPYNRDDFGVLLFDKLEAIYPKSEGEINKDDKGYFFHIVEKGDTLEGLSQRYYGRKDYKNEIIKLNDINSGDGLTEGKILVLLRR